ncbi:coiled-coil domain-containing protein [Geomesophilobacter sediminis]|uniref:Uncharacterized protein n=1 Tax=Geomesophilobacter sediminis TaxID=2798584 RepID=A0A8J7M1I0_9BACT|nr:hypothetical protein [Geomesophilobacter sediminis]MBJ6726723.1 hypothetical protein [Geomesophilobacter sediminis]
MRAAAFPVLASFLVAATVPAFAQTSQNQRDECLLTSRNCMDQVDDLQKRVHKLNRELKKGTRAYSPDELKKLQQKLRETNEQLRRLEESGGS